MLRFITAMMGGHYGLSINFQFAFHCIMSVIEGGKKCPSMIIYVKWGVIEFLLFFKSLGVIKGHVTSTIRKILPITIVIKGTINSGTLNSSPHGLDDALLLIFCFSIIS